jgi:hypothetical protein
MAERLLRVQNPRQNHGDNIDVEMIGDKQGGQLVSQLNLPLYQHAIRGSLFHGMSVTAGHAIPTDDTVTPTYALWNPAGSGVNCIPVCFRFGIMTLGTRVVSAIGFNIVTGLGSTIATGTNCTEFASTPTAIKAADWTTGSSKMLFSNTGTVTVVATTNFFTTGYYHDLAAGGSPPPGIINFDGSWIVPPGTLIFPASHASATGSTYLMQLTWLEVPIPAM